MEILEINNSAEIKPVNEIVLAPANHEFFKHNFTGLTSDVYLQLVDTSFAAKDLLKGILEPKDSKQ